MGNVARSVRGREMVRFLSLAVAGAALAFSQAQAQPYNWVGDNACIVDGALGLRPTERDIRKDAFDWSSAPRSFRIQMQTCASTMSWVSCGPRDQFALRTPNLRGNEHAGWRSSPLRVFNSLDSLETMALEPDGRFHYALLGSIPNEKDSAWFTMTGTCAPFD